MASTGSGRGGKGNANKKSRGDCPDIQLVVRDNKGWRLYKQHGKSGKLQVQSPTKACTDADIVFSGDGQYFAVLLEEGIEVYESQSGRKLFFLAHYRVRNVYFSPKNTFIVSYHHRRQTDKHGNCWVWRWSPSANDDNDAEQAPNDEPSNENENGNGNDDENKAEQDNQDEDGGGGGTDEQSKSGSKNRVIYQFFLPEFNKKHVPLQFSNDEFMAARITRNAVLIHDVKRLHYKSNNIIGKLDVANVASVVVAPTPKPRRRGGGGGGDTASNEEAALNSYLLAVFALPKNTKAATVTIYEYQYNMAMSKKSASGGNNKLFFKISQRAFYNVDQCELLWDETNSYHHNLLAVASADVDTSGKSYYGHQTLFLLSSRNNMTVKIPISEKGKLQDVAWHPNGKEFVMIDDHPQKITLFDFRGNEVKSLGHYARNLVRFSKDGRFLWCGGFGNLTGEMSFYDYKNIRNDKLAVLGYNTDDACRYFAWSPDCSWFLTARLYPYMTVDNGFRIYKYNGQKVYDEAFDRLYQITFRPSKKGVYPARSVSPSARGKAKAIPKPQQKKRYVPPHLRSTQAGSGSGSGPAAPSQPQPQQQPPPPQQPQQPPRQRQPPQQRQQQRQPAQQQAQATQYQDYQQYHPQQQQQQQQQQQGYNHNNNQAAQEYQGFVPHQGQHAAMHHGTGHQQQGQPQPMQPQQQQYGGVYYHHDLEQPLNANGNAANTANVNTGGVGGGADDDADNDANNDNKKRKRRKRKGNNPNKGGTGPGAGAGGGANNAAANNPNGRHKPGLADNDNKRWARGSKYTE